jgi:hypothetical protein
LFPTTTSLSDPKLRPLFHKKRSGRAERVFDHKGQLRALQAAAINAIKVASQIGHVVIVTLAEEAWVWHACGMLMPSLFRLIQETDLQIISAQDFCPDTNDDAAVDQDNMDIQQRLAPLIESKAAAMRHCITSVEGGALQQIISIGDSEVEAHAARKVAMERSSHHPCLHKVLKLCEMPTVEALTAELNTAAWWLPQAVEQPQSTSADIRTLNLKVGPCPTRKVRTPSTQRQDEDNKENEQRKDWLARPLGVNVAAALRRDGMPTPVPKPSNRLLGPRSTNVVVQPRRRSPNPASRTGSSQGGVRKGSCDSAAGLCDQSSLQASVALIAASPIQRLPSIKMRNQ